jgi:hypothetical protein
MMNVPLTPGLREMTSYEKVNAVATPEFIEPAGDRPTFDVFLQGFDEEKLGALREYLRDIQQTPAATGGYHPMFREGSASDVHVLNDLIANELAGLKFTTVTFHNCRFGLESIRAILKLVGRRKFTSLEFKDNCSFEGISTQMMDQELSQFVTTTGVQGLRHNRDVGSHGMVRDFFTVHYPPASCVCIAIEYDRVHLEMEKYSISGDDVRWIFRILQNTVDLHVFNLSGVTCSVDATAQIGQMLVPSVKQGLFALGLGPWDVTNSDANRAIYDLIRNGRGEFQLTLGSSEKKLPTLSVDDLADALSSSLGIYTLVLNLQENGLHRAIDFIERLSARINCPNRPMEIWYKYDYEEEWNDHGFDANGALYDRFLDARQALNLKLSRMQSTSCLVLISLVYAVTLMKGKKMAEKCLLRMLNVDAIRKLGLFLC